MMLRLLLRAYREYNKLSLRDLERMTGVSYVTLHRFEHGRPIQHPELIKIWQWLMKEPKR